MPTLHNASRFALSMAFAATVTPGEAAADASAVPHEEIMIPSRGSIEVPDDAWSKLEHNRTVKSWRTQGMLTVGGERPKLAPVNAAGSATLNLGEMTETDAVEMVGLIEDTDELRQLADLDPRKKVKTAIAKRLRELGA